MNIDNFNLQYYKVNPNELDITILSENPSTGAF